MDNKLFRLERATIDQVRTNQIVRIPSRDGSIHAFNDMAIEKVVGEIVHLARPYLRSDGKGGHESQVERFVMHRDMLCERAYVVYEGGKPASVA